MISSLSIISIAKGIVSGLVKNASSTSFVVRVLKSIDDIVIKAPTITKVTFISLVRPCVTEKEY